VVVTVLAGGLSLEWWGSTGLGSMAMIVLGTAVGSYASPVHDEAATVDHKRPEQDWRLHSSLTPRSSSQPSRISARTDAPFVRVPVDVAAQHPSAESDDGQPGGT